MFIIHKIKRVQYPFFDNKYSAEEKGFQLNKPCTINLKGIFVIFN